jgi:hypothetical protein
VLVFLFVAGTLADPVATGTQAPCTATLWIQVDAS